MGSCGTTPGKSENVEVSLTDLAEETKRTQLDLQPTATPCEPSCVPIISGNRSDFIQPHHPRGGFSVCNELNLHRLCAADLKRKGNAVEGGAVLQGDTRRLKDTSASV